MKNTPNAISYLPASLHIFVQNTRIYSSKYGEIFPPKAWDILLLVTKVRGWLSLYKFNDSQFVLLVSRLIVPPPRASPSLLKNLYSFYVGVDRTVRLTKQLYFWHSMLNDRAPLCAAKVLRKATQQDTYIDYARTQSQQLTTTTTMPPPPPLFYTVNETLEQWGFFLLIILPI